MAIEHLTLISTIILLTLHGAGILLDYYLIFPYFDTIVHVIGGFWTAIVFVYYCKKYRKVLINEKLLRKMAITVGFVTMVAIIWEFFEFYLNIRLDSPAQTYIDTITDVIWGIFGSLIAGFVIFHNLQNKNLLKVKKKKNRL